MGADSEGLRIAEDERFEKIYDALPIPYQSLDENGCFIFINRAWCEELGYSPSEVKGRWFGEFLAPQHVDHFKAAFIRFKAAGRVKGIQFEMKRKDGSLITVRFNGRIGFNKHGEFIQTHSMFQDVTSHIQTKKALQESKDRLQDILESLPGLILQVNRECVIVWANETAMKEAPQCLGKNFNEIQFNNKSICQRICPCKQTIETEKITHGTLLYEKGRDKSYWEHTGIPLRGKDSQVMGAIVILRDVTETKRLHDLEHRAQRLETAGRIAGQVAHDFNNLLAPIMAYPELIKSLLPKDHSALDFIGDMENSARQIAEINQQLLTLGRRAHYQRAPMNLNEIIRQVAREKNQTLGETVVFTELDKDLMNVMGGKAQIFRVIMNLVNNALEATEGRGEVLIKTENYYVNEIAVSYGIVPKGEYVKITVSDTGCGIPENIIQKIFDPFFTNKTMDRKQGSGLGLSVVDAVMKDHNGFIDLTSEIGRGTSIYLYFPFTWRRVTPQDYSNIRGGSESILIVDDDQVQREVFFELLKRLGYRVKAVKSGEEALEHLEACKCDLMILDMVMTPGMDGVETFKKAIRIQRGLKALIVSGHVENHRVQSVQRMGAGAYVQKPITYKRLAEAVRAELDKKESQAEVGI